MHRSFLRSLVLWQHSKMSERIDQSILLLGRAGFIPLVQAVAVRGDFDWQTAELLHMGDPAGFGQKAIGFFNICLNFFVGCHGFTSFCGHYLIDFIQKSTRKLCCSFCGVRCGVINGAVIYP